ncbi:hypothetical protein LCGC14_2417290 [marine sediment metagenome]|uniref:Uncharacterized protein n=1 Tax=marine sediment metagenome TaxID=412755 RepID=A0A0F9E2X0_9ZZZZ
MKVEMKPIEQNPEVIITLSWEEAKVLRAVCGGTSGIGPGRSFLNGLAGGLLSIGISYHYGEAKEMTYNGKFDSE